MLLEDKRILIEDEQRTLFGRVSATRLLQVSGVLLRDLVLVCVSLLLSLTLTDDLKSANLGALTVNLIAPICLAALILFLARRIYRLDVRYVGVYDLLNIAFVSIILSLTLATIQWLQHTVFTGVSPFAGPVLFGLITMSLLSLARLYPRLFTARHVLTRQAKGRSSALRTLIVGAGDAGEMVYREMTKPSHTGHLIIGFVDDLETIQKSTIHGVPVRGRIADIPSLVKKHQVAEILIAIPTASGDEIRRIWSFCTETSARVRTLPSLSSFVVGSNRVLPMMRELQVDDLLRRKRVDVDKSGIAQLIGGESVLITGAGGSIGSELSRQVARLVPASLTLLGRGENSIFEIDQELRDTQTFHATPIICDVRNRDNLNRVFKKHYPSVVIHAAAHKHVPLMEAVPIEAIQNNVFGTLNVVEEAVQNGAKNFILVSTDKAVKPNNVMGATKRVAEMIISAISSQSELSFSIVRFGNVLGSRGSLVPTLQKQIKRGGPLTLTHPEMTRFFMTIPEAVQLILQAGAMGDRAEIFILDMGKPVSIVDLAHDMVRMHGLVPGQDIDIKFTGVRPGEKLHEELATDAENLKPSSHANISVVANPPQISWSWLKAQLEFLRNLCDEGHADEARAFLMDLAWGKNIPPVQTSGPELQPSEELN